MKQEYEEFLVKKFPLLYAGYDGDATKTCMARGFEVGDGWFNLIHGLSLAIQSHIDWANKQADDAIEWNAMVDAGEAPTWWGDRPDKPTKRKVPRRVKQVVVSQVKEKFGLLRFTAFRHDTTVGAFIRAAEHTSSVTCETCGAPGEIIRGVWISVLCPACEAKRNLERS